VEQRGLEKYCLQTCKGATIALFDVNRKLLDKTVDEFKSKGFRVSGHQVNISSEDVVRFTNEKRLAPN
jgi:hypothetical protein